MPRNCRYRLDRVVYQLSTIFSTYQKDSRRLIGPSIKAYMVNMQLNKYLTKDLSLVYRTLKLRNYSRGYTHHYQWRKGSIWAPGWKVLHILWSTIFRFRGRHVRSSYIHHDDAFLSANRVGFRGTTTFVQYGSLFRLHRKEMARLIGSSSAMKSYTLLEEVETHRFLLRLLDEPQKLIQHIRTWVSPTFLAPLTKRHVPVRPVP